MTTDIVKTTIEVTVLHHASLHIGLGGLGLAELDDEMDYGECVGVSRIIRSAPLWTVKAVRQTLLALGNDGHFFDTEE